MTYKSMDNVQLYRGTLPRNCFEHLIGLRNGIRTKFPEETSWPCALSDDPKIIFTQLISADHQMRDGYYEYILLIGADYIVISYNDKAKIEEVGSWKSYKKEDIIKVVDQCSRLITEDHKPLCWH